MSFTEDQARARFHELGAQREAILARSVPLREKRDKISQDAAKKVAGLNITIAEAEKGLFEIDQERAFLVRALKRQTGPAPAVNG